MINAGDIIIDAPELISKKQEFSVICQINLDFEANSIDITHRYGT